MHRHQHLRHQTAIWETEHRWNTNLAAFAPKISARISFAPNLVGMVIDGTKMDRDVMKQSNAFHGNVATRRRNRRLCRPRRNGNRAEEWVSMS
jgi:hypothetical protein